VARAGDRGAPRRGVKRQIADLDTQGVRLVGEVLRASAHSIASSSRFWSV
jgi:hypothetical protein